MAEIPGFHIPGYQGKTTVKTVGKTHILLPQLTPDDITRAADHLMGRGREILTGYSTDDLATIFGRVADFWQSPSPEKEEVVAAISELTGLSLPVVDRSLSVEQGNSSTADILAAMDRDLNDHRCLDHFVNDDNLQGMTRAYGPEVIAAILTANVPGLSYLPMVRSLMVKSPLMAKLASSEPIFGPAWIKSVAQIEPPLAECVALFCWSGGNPELEKPMFDPAPVVIVYGGEETVNTLRQSIGPHKKIVEHGHKIGLVLIGREKLADEKQVKDLAQRLALDVAMFDQRACIAPQIIYAEKNGKITTQELATMIDQALAEIEPELPTSTMTLDTAATLAQTRNEAAFAAAQNPDRMLLAGDKSTIIHEAEASFNGVLPTRFLRICPVDDLDQVIPILTPKGSYLQNVGLETSDDRKMKFAEALGRIGVSHITSPGLMHRPTMRWKHDGISSFSELVRWVDIEG